LDRMIKGGHDAATLIHKAKKLLGMADHRIELEKEAKWDADLAEGSELEAKILASDLKSPPFKDPGAFAPYVGEGISRVSALERATRFASKDQNRVVLTHVLIRKDDVIASDGHRLISVPICDGEDVSLVWDPAQKVVVNGSYYQKVDDILDETSDTHAILNPSRTRKALQLAIKMQRAMTLKGESPKVLIRMTQDVQLIIGSMAIQIGRRGDMGGAFDVCINPIYLKDALAGASGAVDLCSDEPLGVIRVNREDGERHCIMPIMTR